MMNTFVANMELPENYIQVLIKVATENNMTAEQFARNIMANHIKNNYKRDLTQD